MLLKKRNEEKFKILCRSIFSLEWIKFISELTLNDPTFNLDEFIKDFQLYVSYFDRTKIDLPLSKAKKLVDINDDKNFTENFHDEVMKLYWTYEKNDYIERIKSGRLSRLINEDIIEEVKIILDNNISPNLLNEQFFSIYGNYTNEISSADLLESLKRYRKKNIGWSRKFYLNRIKEENLNVKILDDQNGYFVFETEDYEACKALGPQSWCIVQSEFFFDHYTNNNRRQYIVMKFDEPISDNFSLIGLTTDNTGRVTDSYDRDNVSTPKSVVNSFKFPSY